MVQVVIAVLAITFAGVSGWILVEQTMLHEVASNQRENSRRLDLAADAVTGALGSVPGSEGLYAPLGSAGADWQELPANLGAVNETVAGIPFLYCPLGSANSAGSVEVGFAGDESYTAETEAGFVVADDLSLGSGYSRSAVAAFVVGAGRQVSAPPPCSSIQYLNGNFTVPDGIVRVVGRPQGRVTAETEKRPTEFYVSATSVDGNGRSAGSPVSIDKALEHWLTFRPTSMTLNIVGTATPSASVWSAFAPALAGSDAEFTVRSESGGVLVTPAGQFPVTRDTTLSNVSISGSFPYVSGGDQLTINGNVSIAPATGTPQSPAVYVDAGGRLAVSDSMLTIRAPGAAGIVSFGDVTVVRSNLLPVNGTGTVASLLSGSRLLAQSAAFGGSAARPGIAAIYANGAWGFSADATSIAYGAAGNCWQSEAGVPGDFTFAYSSNGVGAVSTVTPDPAGASEEELDARRKARSINQSAMTCA